MRAFKLLLPVVLVVVCVSVVQADTINVPGEQPTIQAGIDAAVDGDTVLVADGTYTGDGNRDIDFLGKAIVVMSENGPENCIIDCEGSNENRRRGFYFHSGEDANSVLQGFTITNGWEEGSGGGISCFRSSPTITGNKITGNRAGGHGGGISCYDDCNPTITGNMFTGNTADNSGGGIYCYRSSPTIEGNKISDNNAGYLGGGLSFDASSSATIDDNTIVGNRGGYGGGVSCSNSSSPTLTNSTIANNRALEWGGGVYCAGGISTTITNTILWDNNANVGDELWIDDNPTVVTISYSDIEGGLGSVYIRPGGILNWGDGMIDDDPLFVDPENDDYRLMAGSPCIDTGDPDMPCVPWGGWWLDMGAYEYDQGFYFNGQNLIRKPFPVVFSDKR